MTQEYMITKKCTKVLIAASQKKIIFFSLWVLFSQKVLGALKTVGFIKEVYLDQVRTSGLH